MLNKAINEDHIIIGVVHDWDDLPRPNRFNEDMRRDQIRLEVAELLSSSLDNIPNVTSLLISFSELREDPKLIDAALNVAYGENGRFHLSTVPVFLDSLGIPNFGADPFQMLLARNKQHTKLIAKSLGVLTPQSLYVDQYSVGIIDELDDPLFERAIVKPNESASGLGLENKIYQNLSEIKSRAKLLLEAYPEGIIIEDFIPGQEVTVGVLSDRMNTVAFPYIQRNLDSTALSENYINSFEENLAAYERGERKWFQLKNYGTKVQCEQAVKSSIRIANEIGIAGYVRADFRLTDDGSLYFLELNGQAGIGLKGSVVISIGKDYFDHPHGFINEIAVYAHSFLSAEINSSRSSEQEKRWSNQ